ncbi:chymotrypsin-like protease CTRL-1 [Eurytemora carolleeae]|uniref:chymotrypsin-like protease CTRL-1 n=1 Tax=Eurytemora carolleeae TaxID=1294199 RepID=UPI000C783166|nr:chymotrypsin-like protease CTRL-1 [Eurytemora carolleeae]|eukprot:XP_023336265.1 chymotrypsin-like protease CTRL-1 [Eurytemora affinis]
MKGIILFLITAVGVCHSQDIPEEPDVEIFNDDNFEGPKTAALVDGENADRGEHPWHVGLVREESKTGFLGWVRHLGGLIRTTTYCGASLVSTRWLVTAAHCIREDDRPVDLRVVMGSSKRARYFYYFFQTDSIDQIRVHPDYDTGSHNYDIALLRLKKLPELVPGELWPVCLPSVPVESYEGQKATVIGWGRTEGKDGISARHLQELDVEIISQETCQTQWGYGKGRVEIGGPKMCFRSSGASCHGDSGGGMFVKKMDSLELVGVCSYGLADCQNWAPEVYTKVSFVIDWIKKTIRETDLDDLNMPQCGKTTINATNRRRRADPVFDWVYKYAKDYVGNSFAY